MEHVSNRPTRCESDLSSALVTALREVCTEMGGSYISADTTTAPPTPERCTPPTAGISACPANEFPIGFASDGRSFNCAPLPAVSNADPSHPTGFNCFLRAIYHGNHGQPKQLFQPADTNALTDIERLDRWAINSNATCGNVIAGVMPCSLPGGINFTTYVCPSGYSYRFINPIHTVYSVKKTKAGVASWSPGAYASYMQQYCCK